MSHPALYDFSQPLLVTPEQSRALRAVHERFGRTLCAHLSGRIQALVSVAAGDVEQQTLEAFGAALEGPAVYYVLRAEGVAPPCVLALDTALALYLTERLLGGDGVRKAEGRPLTLLEQRMTQRQLVERWLRELEAAWHAAQALHLHVERAESSPTMLELDGPGARLVTLRFEVAVEGFRAGFALLYPLGFLQASGALAGKGAAVRPPEAPVPEAERAAFEEAVGQTAVELRAELGRTRLPLAELLQLQEGDVILLDHRTDEPLSVFVGTHERFQASPGRAGRRAALRISLVLPTPHQ